MDLRTLAIISTLFLMTNGLTLPGNNSTTNGTVRSVSPTNFISTTATPTSNPRHAAATQSRVTIKKTQPKVPVCSSEGQGQLKAYKVATAFLCCILLILLLIRFTKPTVQALQKRLSDRRQNRWVGPTQSHSVSYHRGKSAVKNNDGEKRLSYPALDRLVIPDSREPSSNRNSGYNL